jgi:hypothetical protein
VGNVAERGVDDKPTNELVDGFFDKLSLDVAPCCGDPALGKTSATSWMVVVNVTRSTMLPVA